MNETKATRYQRLRRRGRVASVVSAVAVVAAIACTPASRWLADAALGLAGGAEGFVSLAFFVVPIVLLAEFSALPALLYLALSVDGAYGRAAQTVEDVLGAAAQAAAVALPAALGAAVAVRVAVAVGGPIWWIVAGLLMAGGLAAALRVAPLILRSIAASRPLGRPVLVARLTDLATRIGVPVAGIDEWVIADASRATALVAGVGGARRVLVSSEMARTWTDEEISVVVVHELAHHAHGDLWRTFALDASVLLAALFAGDLIVGRIGPSLGLTGTGDFAALPLLALVTAVAWIAATPARHAQSRRHERRADVFALALTGAADAFDAVIRRLGAKHLAEERPSALTRWFHHRHPSVAERLALAESYRRVRAFRQDQ